METFVKKYIGHFLKYMMVQQFSGSTGNIDIFFSSFLLHVVIFNTSCVIIAVLKTDA